MSNLVYGIVALGTTQGTAYAIHENGWNNQVATCTSTANGVVLPSGVAGYEFLVRNDGVAALNVYPPSSAAINGAAVNIAFSVPSGAVATFIPQSATQWYCTMLNSTPSLAVSAAMTALAGGAQPALAANVIPANQIYSVVGTCATAKDSIALPDVPMLNQPYLVVNNGVAACALWPGLGVAASIVDNQTANLPFFLGAKARCVFTAVSNAAGVIQWYSSGYVGGKANVPIAAIATLTNQHNNCVISVTGTTYVITLPSLAAACGNAISFNFTAAVTAVTITSPTASSVRGGISAGSAVHATVADVTNVICTTMALGDQLTFVSDGAKYYLTGFIKTTGDVTTS